jgi:pimeloyl-ACP methyl ester carboxylesterase
MSNPAPPVHLVDRGNGGPALVFVHGFSCSLNDWDLQVAHFVRSHRCIAIDLPGHGGSPRSAAPTIEGCAGAVAAALAGLGVEDAVLVGHSMGCRVISQTCLLQPERVRGLVYVDGSFIAGDPVETVARTEARVAGAGFDAFIEQAYREFHVVSTPAAVRDRVNAHRAHISADFSRPLVVDMVRWDVTRGRTTLAAIAAQRVPVLAIQSTVFDADLNRVAVTPGTLSPFSGLLSGALPDLEIATIPAGHFPMLESPEATNRAIAGLVRRIGAAA